MTIFALLEIYKAKMFLFGMTNDVKSTYSVGDTMRANLHVILSKRKRIGDNKYNVYRYDSK